MEVHFDNIATTAEGQAILDEVDGAILGIENQFAFDDGRNGPVWCKRAESALKKRRQRPGLQQRIGGLRRAERQATAQPPIGLGPDRRDARRKTFIDAAEELIGPEVFTEVCARAAERGAGLFEDVRGDTARTGPAPTSIATAGPGRSNASMHCSPMARYASLSSLALGSARTAQAIDGRGAGLGAPRRYRRTEPAARFLLLVTCFFDRGLEPDLDGSVP